MGQAGGLARRDSTSSFMSNRPDRGSESGLLDNLLQEGGLPVRRLHLMMLRAGTQLIDQLQQTSGRPLLMCCTYRWAPVQDREH